jgi:predicted amidohydrolase
VSKNLSTCTRLMRLASSQGAKLVFFPEASDFIGNPPEEALTLASPISENTKEGEGEFLKGICEEARSLGIGCSVGVHEQVPGGGGGFFVAFFFSHGRRTSTTSSSQLTHLSIPSRPPPLPRS